MHSSTVLLNTTFCYNCKLFGLGALDEHRNLQSSQITLGSDDSSSYIAFQDQSTKYLKYGIKQYINCQGSMSLHKRHKREKFIRYI